MGGGGTGHVFYVAQTPPPDALGPSLLDGYATGLPGGPLWNRGWMPPAAILDVVAACVFESIVELRGELDRTPLGG